MGAWRPVCVVFILTISSFFGIFAMYETDVATGTLVGGPIMSDTTWTLTGSPYQVIGNVIVVNGATLTIEPGVEVIFESRFSPPLLHIFVEGGLNATGNATNMIQINKTDPGELGWWGAIQINSTGKADIRYCNMNYGDSSIVIMSSSRVNVTNNVIQGANSALQRFGTLTPRHYVANNTFLRSELFLDSSNNIVVDNVFQEYGVVVYGDRNLIQNNVFSKSSKSAITIDTADRNLILLNGVFGTVTRGIMLHDSSHNTISGNVLWNNTERGIDLLGGTNNTVSENIVSDSEYCIVYIGGNGIIENNTLADCSLVGIRAGEDYNLIFGNNITNSGVGISTVFATYSKIVLNDLRYGSVYGIRLWDSDNITVYHNNFIGNAIQAWDDNTTGRFWDAGYPFGGNYWSDYSGIDAKSGPDQNIPGSDGIGDTPYLINISSRDRYPLTERATLNLPPRNVWAHLTGRDFENVTIIWNLSWNDGQRANDVTGYEIYRSSTYDSERAGYALVASTGNQTTEFVDVFSGEGDPNNYFYYVCALNGTGNSACSVNQVGKFTRPLSKGINLVSIPLIQSNPKIETVLQTVSFDKAWRYDSYSQEWNSFMKAKPYSGDLKYVNHTIGLWISVTKDSNLTVAGVVPSTAAISFRAGWNLVGYPALVNRTLSEYLSQGEWCVAEGFDDMSSPYFLKKVDSSYEMKPGEALWVYFLSDFLLVVSNLGEG